MFTIAIKVVGIVINNINQKDSEFQTIIEFVEQNVKLFGKNRKIFGFGCV